MTKRRHVGQYDDANIRRFISKLQAQAAEAILLEKKTRDREVGQKKQTRKGLLDTKKLNIFLLTVISSIEYSMDILASGVVCEERD